MLKSLLVPVDGSEYAAAAVGYAAALAGRVQGRVTLLHVVDMVSGKVLVCDPAGNVKRSERNNRMPQPQSDTAKRRQSGCRV